jgi:hypothetical protein
MPVPSDYSFSGGPSRSQSASAPAVCRSVVISEGNLRLRLLFFPGTALK